MTAEFAVVLPAVLLVLSCCLGAVGMLTQQARLSGAASSAARALARGDDAATVHRAIRRAVGPVRLGSRRAGDFLCLGLDAPASFGPARFAGMRVSAHACVLDGRAS